MQVKLKKALTVANIQNQTVHRLTFSDDFYQAFGKPQNKGVWGVWGGSASGKSTFMMMLAKEFAKIDKTIYNLLEEEPDDSDYIDRTRLIEMGDVQDKFHTVSFNKSELQIYLKKRNPPHFIIIDSLPYFDIYTFEDYLEFKRKHRSKIIVFVMHAEGKHPLGDLARRIMYDCKMKIYISGYVATCKGRTIGPNGGQYIIWQEGYEKLNGTNNH